MKIEHLELTFLRLPLLEREGWAWGGRDSLSVGLVELHTSTGITGIGEVTLCMGPDADATRAIFDQMARMLAGESALNPGRVLARVKGGGWHPFRHVAGLVLGGIEMACWDAMGKHLGQPVSTFFGGALRLSLPSMYYVQEAPIDDMLARSKEAAERGFQTVYYKVGWDEPRDVELVARAREALGPDVRLRIDANEGWSVGTALRILRRLARYDIEYIEQPVSMYDIDGLAHLRHASGVAIGANQSSWGAPAIIDIIRKQAADVIMTDPHQEGGLLPTKAVLGVCEMAGLPFVNHAFNPTTITFTSHLHLMSTSTAILLDIQGHPDLLADDYVTEPLDYTGGSLTVPQGPGLGLELDPDKRKRYAAEFERLGAAPVYPDQPGDPLVLVPAR